METNKTLQPNNYDYRDYNNHANEHHRDHKHNPNHQHHSDNNNHVSAMNVDAIPN